VTSAAGYMTAKENEVAKKHQHCTDLCATALACLRVMTLHRL
jgi:hypothetical protein